MEQIFTIPVNEEFDACRDSERADCPFCRLYRRLQADEVDIILGASMMEPDIRIKTNEQGFCGRHYTMMLSKKRMLGMGLMLESHLAEVRRGVAARSLLGDVSSSSSAYISRLNDDCYICSRIKRNLDGMISTAVYLYESDDDFVTKFKKQHYFCLPHYNAMISYASKKMAKKHFREFFTNAQQIQNKYLETLNSDVSWFCKKFDYNYEEEPWYNSKDSVQRSIRFLSGALDEE